MGELTKNTGPKAQVSDFGLDREFDGYLYHATSAHNLTSILAEGLRPGSYLARSDDSLPSYYAETVEDEGGVAVVLCVQVEDLLAAHLAPDKLGIEEPITTVLGKTEDEVIEEWENCEGTWRDCFSIIGSVRYMGVIPAEVIDYLTRQAMDSPAFMSGQ